MLVKAEYIGKMILSMRHKLEDK